MPLSETTHNPVDGRISDDDIKNLKLIASRVSSNFKSIKIFRKIVDFMDSISRDLSFEEYMKIFVSFFEERSISINIELLFMKLFYIKDLINEILLRDGISSIVRLTEYSKLLKLYMNDFKYVKYISELFKLSDSFECIKNRNLNEKNIIDNIKINWNSYYDTCLKNMEELIKIFKFDRVKALCYSQISDDIEFLKISYIKELFTNRYGIKIQYDDWYNFSNLYLPNEGLLIFENLKNSKQFDRNFKLAIDYFEKQYLVKREAENEEKMLFFSSQVEILVDFFSGRLKNEDAIEFIRRYGSAEMSIAPVLDFLG